MTEDPSRPTNDSQAWASSLVRPLSRRYLFALTAVAALVLIDQAILQPLLVQLNLNAPVINLAGRQRMLSQKVTKEALALVATQDAAVREARRDELRRSLERWSAAHRTLLDGDVAQGVQPVDPQIAMAIGQVEPAHEAILAAAREIADESTASPSVASAAVVTILEQEPTYLSGMEAVVAMLEQSARTQVAWLRGCGLAVMTSIMILLVGVYYGVLRPATQLIREQVEQLAKSDSRHRQLADMLREARDRLELRVAERTSELSTANAALEREMAERQAAESRMRELSTELAHVARVSSLGELATGLAHEINQPLATVANYAGTLELALERACPSDPEPRRLVGQIQQASLRAGAIVRRMRNFVRGAAVQAAPVELNDLVRDVSELCRYEISAANVTLTLELTPQSVLVLADGLQVQQVLVNLIQNAIQAMASASALQRSLRISTEVNTHEVVITVADTGPGFAAEDAEKCFEPFFSTKAEGLGMGLAISRSIIQQHQGRIWSENRGAGGAVVGFSLPITHAHDTSQEQHAHCVCG